MQNELQDAITLKDFIPLFSAMLGVVILCIGWYVTHWLNSKRDKQNKLREIRLQYLIEAYRNLADSLHREHLDTSHIEKLESAVRDIQLFGSNKQVSYIRNFSIEFAKEKTAVLDNLINDLRDDLRNELNLLNLPENNIWLRVKMANKSVEKKR